MNMNREICWKQNLAIIYTQVYTKIYVEPKYRSMIRKITNLTNPYFFKNLHWRCFARFSSVHFKELMLKKGKYYKKRNNI